jgi:arylsulfatase A-like enzyme
MITRLDPGGRPCERPAGVTETTEPRERWNRWLPGTAAGTATVLVSLYALAIHRLASTTGSMDSQFSKVAKEDHLSYLIGQNLYVLLAYVILWVAAILLILPAVSLLRRIFPSRRRGAAWLPALVLAAAVNGYCAMRLTHARPYFMTEAQFGHWYHRLLELPPESWRPWVNRALFDGLPWLAAGLALVWWFRHLGPRLRWAAAALLLAAAVTLAWPADAGPQTAAKHGKLPPNVIIVGSDSLRGDRLGYAGYRPARSDGPAADGVSPRIDAWAREAARFRRCYTPIGSTMESGVCVFSSTWPHTHGIRHMFPRREQVEAATAKIETLADLLAAQGYDTAAMGDWCANYYNQIPLGFRDISVSSYDNFRMYISQTVLLSHQIVPAYFDNALGYRMFPQMESFASFVTPAVVTSRVEAKLARQAASGRPFFWHVFFSCNHLPYRAEKRYARMFGDPAYRGPNRDEVKFDINGFVSGTDMEDKLKALSEDEVRQIRALYDGCTREFDDCFGRIVAALEREGLAENTIVVMTSDHGDDLYEPGVTLTHGLGFNGGDHCSHVPLAIAGPGISGRDLPQQVRTIDLAPTLAELLGLDVPATWEGRGLAGWIDGSEPPRDLPFYGETSFPYILFRVPGVERPEIRPMDEMTMIDRDYNYHFVLKPEWEKPVVDSKQRCLRTRDWKVVCTPARDGSRHFGLFHTLADPDCRNDLAALRPEVLEPMKAALERWIDRREESAIETIFPAGEPR